MPDSTNPLGGSGGIGGLDQTMRLRASLEDEVTPALTKIEKGVGQTAEQANKMAEAVKAAGQASGQATTGMADRVTKDLDKVNKGLKESQEAYEGFADRTTGSAKKIGQAVSDSIYSGSVENRMRTVNKDIERLDQTMKGLASSQRTVSAHSKRVTASAKDTINKKVIPAFQELHGTLDEYPDTLDAITTAEQNRLNVLTKSEGILTRVTDRVNTMGESLNKMKFGLGEIATIGTAGLVGGLGQRMQQRQVRQAQLGGLDKWDKTPDMLKRTGASAEAFMGDLAPIVDTLTELQTVGEGAFEGLSKQIWNTHKATGVAAQDITHIYDAMTRLSGMKGSDATATMDMMALASQNSSANIEELIGNTAAASTALLQMAESSRKAFAASSIASAAQAKNIGLDANQGLDLRERVLSGMSDQDFGTMRAKILRATGQDINDPAIANDTTKLQQLFAQAAQQEVAIAGGPDALSTRFGRKRIQQALPGLSMEEITRYSQGSFASPTGEMPTPEQLMQESPGIIDSLAERIRNIGAERIERAGAKAQVIGMDPAMDMAHLADKIAGGMDTVATEGLRIWTEMDADLKRILSAVTAGGLTAGGAISAAKGIGGGLAGLLGLGGAAAGGGSLLGAIGSKIFGGGGGGPQGGGGGSLLGFAGKSALWGTATLGMDALMNPDTMSELQQKPGQRLLQAWGKGAGMQLGSGLAESVGMPKWVGRLGAAGLYGMAEDKLFDYGPPPTADPYAVDPETARIRRQQQQDLQSQLEAAEGDPAQIRQILEKHHKTMNQGAASPAQATATAAQQQLLQDEARKTLERGNLNAAAAAAVLPAVADRPGTMQRGTPERQATDRVLRSRAVRGLTAAGVYKVTGSAGGAAAASRVVGRLGGAAAVASTALEIKEQGWDWLKEGDSKARQRELMARTAEDGGIAKSRIYNADGSVNYFKLMQDQPAWFTFIQNQPPEKRAKHREAYAQALKGMADDADVSLGGRLDKIQYYATMAGHMGESFEGWKARKIARDKSATPPEMLSATSPVEAFVHPTAMKDAIAAGATEVGRMMGPKVDPLSADQLAYGRDELYGKDSVHSRPDWMKKKKRITVEPLRMYDPSTAQIDETQVISPDILGETPTVRDRAETAVLDNETRQTMLASLQAHTQGADPARARAKKEAAGESGAVVDALTNGQSRSEQLQTRVLGTLERIAQNTTPGSMPSAVRQANDLMADFKG